MARILLEKELNQLEALIHQFDKTNSQISKASVGWHLDHSFRVISAVCKSTLKSDPSEYRYKRNKNRTKIKLIGYIPRGLGKAPEAVTPVQPADKEHLLIHFNEVKVLLLKLNKLSSKHYFKHPVFGGLDKKATIWFLKIHTRHHLKIMKDILKASKI